MFFDLQAAALTISNMFNHAKKKQEEENTIVDHIIQVYAEQSTVDSKLLDFINEKAYNEEEKRELLVSLDKYNTLLFEHPMFDKFKKRLFGTNKNQLILTHIELSVCFLISTQKYYPEAIIDILWIDKERFREIV
ncbi:MAG: hypothetical protein LBG19_06620 [Prevotellaceae bacterium]|jgi:hypothetical protein|nr:hypothetical protein [Prevotellaceae bacterium]